MKIVRSIEKAAKLARKVKLQGKSVGFVPTMGALHNGHLSLIHKARSENDFTVVSIFVNPAQFGRGEDFKKYPRNLSRDAALCKKSGVDLLFIPQAEKMYPAGYKTYIRVNELGEVLCGPSRPGHFQGVTTVVAKLFNIISPDSAYFGQKDAQQAVIIKKMAEDLNMPVKIKILPTAREKDGLALSSRNAYLNMRERKDALVLNGSLELARALVKRGMKDPGRIKKIIKNIIRTKKSAKIDYVEIVDARDLSGLSKIRKNSLIALAVRIGRTRLIDNVIIK